MDKKRIKNAYDPTCGSGSLLLRIAREAKVGEFYGQELNRTTYNLARMNMILHDVHFSRFDLKQEDTLEEPQHLDLRFEAIVANPPFSAKWRGKDNPLFETDDRFSQYGSLVSKSYADFSFVQHIIHQLADNGTAAIILPHGVLFRGGAEQVVREYIIKELNYLDCVIGLPKNIFYGTEIPACILVLKKCRAHDKDILFIDASEEYEQIGTKNALSDAHVEKIIAAYYIVEVGDFVYNPRISVSAPVGPINRNDLATGVMSPLYDVFRFNFLNTDFFRHFFLSSEWHRYMHRIANFGARHDRMAISMEDFFDMPIPWPDPKEQESIANFLNTIDLKISLLSGGIVEAYETEEP